MDELVSHQTKAWVEAKIGSPIESITQLKGASSSDLFKITPLDAPPVVLRLLTNKDWLANEPDLARHEASALDHVNIYSRNPRAYPSCIAYDEFGKEAGLPAVIMSFVEGEVRLPRDIDRDWISHLAATLTEIHQIPIEEYGWRYRHWYHIDQLKKVSFSWSSIPDTWQQGINYLNRPDPAYPPRFLHRDYHPVNLLWRGKAVSGVVDWVNACIGPALVDVGHCRVNLTSLYGLEAADRFLEAYLELNPSVEYTPFWDLTCIMSFEVDEAPSIYTGWLDFGFTGLTPQLLADRMDHFVDSLLKKPKG